MESNTPRTDDASYHFKDAGQTILEGYYENTHIPFPFYFMFALKTQLSSRASRERPDPQQYCGCENRRDC